MEAFRANPQRTGDKSLYPGVSQIHPSDQHKATGTLMPSNLEKKKCKMFSVYSLPERDPPPKMLSSLPLVKRRNRGETAVQFSSSVMSNSLRPHEPQHARPPCPSATPRVHPNPRPLSRWCRPTISSFVVPFSSCPQHFSASGSFRIRWPKYWSFSFNISPSNEHLGLISFRMDWLDLSRVFSTTTVQKHQFFGAQLSL